MVWPRTGVNSTYSLYTCQEKIFIYFSGGWDRLCPTKPGILAGMKSYDVLLLEALLKFLECGPHASDLLIVKIRDDTRKILADQ